MPYIIKTTTAGFEPDAPVVIPAIVTRHAVATLDEAREAASDVLAHSFAFEAHYLEDDVVIPYYDAAQYMDESGATIGPLPDGTVIEVEFVTGSRLWLLAHPSEPFRNLISDTRNVVDSFNAAQVRA